MDGVEKRAPTMNSPITILTVVVLSPVIWAGRPSVAHGLEPTGIAAPGVWPGRDWEIASPASQGLSSAALDAATRYAEEHGGGSGCIIRHGYLVKEWGDPTKLADIKSATKASVGATLLGLAVDRN